MERNFARGRSAKRRRVGSSAYLKNGTGLRINAKLFNVSEGGCAIFVPNARLIIQRFYTITMDGLESLTARVIWVREPFAGLEFINPLHPAVAEHLGNLFSINSDDPVFSDGDLLVEIVRYNAGARGHPFDPPMKA